MEPTQAMSRDISAPVPKFTTLNKIQFYHGSLTNQFKQMARMPWLTPMRTLRILHQKLLKFKFKFTNSLHHRIWQDKFKFKFKFNLNFIDDFQLWPGRHKFKCFKFTVSSQMLRVCCASEFVLSSRFNAVDRCCCRGTPFCCCCRCRWNVRH